MAESEWWLKCQHRGVEHIETGEGQVSAIRFGDCHEMPNTTTLIKEWVT